MVQQHDSISWIIISTNNGIKGFPDSWAMWKENKIDYL